jgi:hypothetical protein
MKNLLLRLKGLASDVVAVGIITATLAVCVQTAIEAVRELRADDEFLAYMLSEAKRSEAHRFLVTNWLQCRPITNTRASCLAGIRGAGASRGVEFVQQIDRAARDMKLI